MQLPVLIPLKPKILEDPFSNRRDGHKAEAQGEKQNNEYRAFPRAGGVWILIHTIGAHQFDAGPVHSGRPEVPRR